MLAMSILAAVMLTVTYLTAAAHQHLHEGEQALRGLRLGEHLLEEIASRPYEGTGGSERPSWHVSDFDDFEQAPGEQSDFENTPYGEVEQIFTRQVEVETETLTVAELEEIAIEGKLVTVTVEHPGGTQWQLQRFIPESLP